MIVFDKNNIDKVKYQIINNKYYQNKIIFTILCLLYLLIILKKSKTYDIFSMINRTTKLNAVTCYNTVNLIIDNIVTLIGYIIVKIFRHFEYISLFILYKILHNYY